MKIEIFIKELVRLRNEYYELEKELQKENITAKEVSWIASRQQRIAEDITRFVLNPTENAEMLFERLIKSEDKRA